MNAYNYTGYHPSYGNSYYPSQPVNMPQYNQYGYGNQYQQIPQQPIDEISGKELLAKFKEINNSSDSSTQTSWRAMINKIIA